MANGPNSVEFCGVKLVRWGYRPRNAVKVLIGYCTLALLKNGSVACSADSPFEGRRGWRVDPHGWAYLNQHLADDLLKLGAITPEKHKQHKVKVAERLERRQARDAAEAVRDGFKLFGLSFTDAQSKVLANGETAF